ncbi:MAG: hypothetical protein JNM86_09735 [Phycisphaerae bacterium]|nr:hypothetical protein [Phycisphaerae bacterium]
MLTDGDPILIEEWLTLAQSLQRRVDHALLPALLDWGAGKSSRSKHVIAVAGTRGTWLATLNPAWASLRGVTSLPNDPASAWSTGSASDRLNLLAAARLEQPALARELIKATAKEDSADERRRFLSQLSVNLSPDDEPFLEEALNDRSKLVREAAADLLLQLPLSAYVARMIARAREAVQFHESKKGILRKKAVALAVALPKEWDASFERDALEQRPPSGVGEKAWWLQQIVARTPPLALFGTATPEAILEAIADSDYSETLPAAIREAAARFGSFEWSIAVARHELDAPRKGKADNMPTVPAGLSTQHAAAVILELIADKRFNLQLSWAYAAGIPRPWPEPISQKVVQLLAAKKPTSLPQWYEVGTAAEDISRSIHPASATSFDSLLRSLFKDDPPPWVVKSIDRLTLRTEMHKEFHS